MECFSWMLAIDFLFCFMFFHLAARLFRTLRFGYTSLQIPYRGFNFKWQPQWFEPIARQQSGCISELLILWVGQERNGICSWSPENCFVFRFQNRKWGLRLCQRENPGTKLLLMVGHVKEHECCFWKLVAEIASYRKGMALLREAKRVLTHRWRLFPCCTEDWCGDKLVYRFLLPIYDFVVTYL